MRPVEAALYEGVVVHKRLRPRLHGLRYRVFSVLLDCSALDDLSRRLRLFSHNRFNLFSLHDRDHGDGTPLGDYLASIAERSGVGGEVARFMMLCYPRVLGYVFNPLTVYFGLDAQDRTRLLIYEVTNTFGERRSYVLPVGRQDDEVITQGCRKRLFVSPFNRVEGRYLFHVTPPGPDLTVGVALETDEGPLLKAHFRGQHRPLSDATLLRALARTGWLTVKVIAGIHYEAAKLWAKGMRPVKRPRHPRAQVSFIPAPKEGL